MDREKIIYKTNLQRTGTIISETIKLLTEYANLKDWEQVRTITIKKNILNKRSSHTINNILRAVKQRFFHSFSELPNVEVLARLLTKEISLTAKKQILHLYVCKSDLLVKHIFLRFAKPRLEFSSNPELNNEEIVDIIDSEAKNHPELRNWSDSVKKRWARGMLAFLRDFGFMEKPPSKKLLTPIIRIETFSFFLFWLLQSLSAGESIKHSIWEFYLLNDFQKRDLLSEAHANGWFHYSTAGDIIELKPRYPSMEEWIDGGLES